MAPNAQELVNFDCAASQQERRAIQETVAGLRAGPVGSPEDLALAGCRTMFTNRSYYTINSGRFRINYRFTDDKLELLYVWCAG